MNFFLLLVAILAVGILYLRRSYPRETTLTLSATICRPASSVFEILENAERAIVWRQHPHWLPAPMRVSTLSCWGEPVGPGRRACINRRGAADEIRMRRLQDREFSYSYLHRHDLSFQSTFRLQPAEGQCQLTWEIRYQVYRLADLLGRAKIAASARKSMADSLEFIGRLALSRQELAIPGETMYEARRGQIPAA